jgi:hypothetical protein
MRKPPAEPVPFAVPAARWLLRVSIGLLVLSLVSTRFGGIQPENAFLVFGLAILAAVLALAACAIGALTIWRNGAPGGGALARSVVLACLLLAFPASLAFKALSLPRINDITTDLTDPPSYSRSRIAVDARQGRILPEYDKRLLPRQQAAYGDLNTILLEQSPEEVMPLIRRVATQLNWSIVEDVPPGGRTSSGRIEATARSSLFRFTDDITIRIRAGAGDTQIDLRSRSRFGSHDFGSNAQRIRAFATEVTALSASR